MLNTIAKSSQALLAILNDILDYSKIEAGKLAVECIPAHLTEVLESVLQLMQISATSKAIELSTQLAADLPLWVMTDPTRLQQVLLNLIGNALKFTPSTPERPGQVSVRVMPCQRTDGPPCLRLSVTDNGIGIKPEQVAKLFLPFSQVDNSTARQFGGTGLGLSISQRLVELMGGAISLQSTWGQGSVFTVELPLQSASVPRLPDPAREPVWHRAPTAPNAVPEACVGQRILLAEDNEINRDVIAEQLRLLGFDAEVAEDGEQALEMWRSGRFALLLTDCHMPNMDGFELTSAIRAEEPALTRLPIIAVTGNAMQGEAERCLAAGMDDYLSKPLRMQALGTVLAKWLPTQVG
jgi:CheY-like chemotaxis protein/two-component sensor histidine kinase